MSFIEICLPRSQLYVAELTLKVRSVGALNPCSLPGQEPVRTSTASRPQEGTSRHHQGPAFKEFQIHWAGRAVDLTNLSWSASPPPPFAPPNAAVNPSHL